MFRELSSDHVPCGWGCPLLHFMACWEWECMLHVSWDIHHSCCGSYRLGLALAWSRCQVRHAACMLHVSLGRTSLMLWELPKLGLGLEVVSAASCKASGGCNPHRFVVAVHTLVPMSSEVQCRCQVQSSRGGISVGIGSGSRLRMQQSKGMLSLMD